MTTTRAALAPICLGCRAQRPELRSFHNVYMLARAWLVLCTDCWDRLPAATRERLELACGANDEARAARQDRLFQLLSALRRGVPLARIQIVA